MEFTGERLVLGQTDIELEIEHLNRYFFAEQFVEGKDVLDAACGTGYGSAILSKTANSVCGIDISDEAVTYSADEYGSEKISFTTGSVTDLPYENDRFDVVISYETIEHISAKEQNQFLTEIKRVLRDGGVLVISSPNHTIYSQRGKNEFHVKELTFLEFKILLESKFQNVAFFGQQFEICNTIMTNAGSEGSVNAGKDFAQSEYLIAVCSDSTLPKIRSNVIMRDDDKLNSLMKWAVDNHNTNERNNKLIAELNSQSQRDKSALEEKDSELKQLQTELQDQRERNNVLIAEMNSQNERSKYALEEKSSELAKLQTELKDQKEKNSGAQAEIKAMEDRQAELSHELEEARAQTSALINGQEAFKAQLQMKIEQARLENVQLMQGEIQRIDAVIQNFTVRIETLEYIANESTLRRLARLILPPGTRRRYFVKLAVKALLHPIKCIKKLKSGALLQMLTAMKNKDIPALEAWTSFSLQPAEDIGRYERFYLTASDTPQVSIIIPAYNQFNYTYQCLRSIRDNTGDVPYEVILADDRSTDLTRRVEEIVFGLRVTRPKKNLRFLLNCNRAAELARGKYILFLNNDTQVQRNWLEPLVTLMEQDSSIGLTGSKLIYPDGTLQEAGGIIWKDASGWNYGRGQDAELPQFNYVRETDYISGASVMIRRELWKQIGGFDKRFAPAYCEDSDLAFAVRAEGYRVVYQPKSVVVHYEGISNGTDTSQGLKAYQVRNQRLFYEKWREVLERENYANGECVFHACGRTRGHKTVLFADHYVPTYDKDSGSRTILGYLRLFVEQGYRVVFIGDNFYRSEPYTGVLQQLGIEVLYGGWFAEHWQEWVLEIAECLDYAFLTRPHIACNYIDFLKSHTRAKILYYGVDLHCLRMRREYELTLEERVLRDAEYWQQREFELMRKADMSYFPSVVEIEEIRRIDPSVRAKAIPGFLYDHISDVDFQLQKRKDVLFVGGFAHAPNVDAVKFLAEKIMPLLNWMVPELKILIVGSHMPDDVRQLEGNGLVMVGEVSDERLVQLYSQTRLCIAPLRYGAGIKGKVLESMRYGLPVVTTSCGAEGIVDTEEILTVADTPEEFAAAVAELYKDRNRLAELSKKGIDYIRTHHTQAQALDAIRGEFDFS